MKDILGSKMGKQPLTKKELGIIGAEIERVNKKTTEELAQEMRDKVKKTLEDQSVKVVDSELGNVGLRKRK